MIEKANILVEALPYIRRFYQKTIVIKYGGHAMVAEELKQSFAKDVVLMKYIGINPVVVHGGGPQIGEMLRRIGKKSDFCEGMRITDADTMEIVEMVLSGRINKEIAALINRHGGRAVGLSGKDAQLIEARKLRIVRDATEEGPAEIIDLGLVGEVARVNLDILQTLSQSDIIPVIAPIGAGENGETYNINADLVAGAIAGALKADKFLLMTDVPGVLDREGKLISSMTVDEAEAAMRDQLPAKAGKRNEQVLPAKAGKRNEQIMLRGGMLPKVQCAIDALKAGTAKVHIVDGRLPHAILLEIFTDAGIGTEILRNSE